MKTKNQTKKALLMSAMSLLLCFSMLIGTTFAWLTDEVSTKNNIIVSGNLDIELYYQNDETSDWTKVDSNTNIFKDSLWEPGHTEVIKLKVVNEGTLALKYQLGVYVENEIPSTNVLGGELKLSDHIKYGVVNGEQNYNRQQAVAAVDATATKLNVAYSKSASLSAGSEEIVTMVVYMPERVGNEANYMKGAKIPTINLGINLFATQLTYEEDSYGPDYDSAAPWAGGIDTTWYFENPDATEFVLDSAEDLAGLAALVNGTAEAPVTTFAATDATTVAPVSFKGKTVKLAKDLDLNNVLWTPISKFEGTFDGQEHTIRNIKMFGTDKVALFGRVIGTVKNLTLNTVEAIGNKYVAALVGYMCETQGIENCHVVNATIVATPVEQSAGGYDDGQHAGGLVGYSDSSNITNCSVTNVMVSAFRDLGGLVGTITRDPSKDVTKIEGCKGTGIQLAYVSQDGYNGHINENMGTIVGRLGGNTTLAEAIVNCEFEEAKLTYVVNTVAQLHDAVDKAKDGEEIYIVAGDYTLKKQINIDSKSLSLIGMGEVNIKTSNAWHMFMPSNYTSPIENMVVTFKNLNIDGGNLCKAGIYAKYNVTVNLENVTIKNTGWADIQIDNGNINKQGGYDNGTKTIVNAKNVTVEDVALNALPTAASNKVGVYSNEAHFNYDDSCSIKSVEKQTICLEPKNLYVNGDNLGSGTMVADGLWLTAANTYAITSPAGLVNLEKAIVKWTAEGHRTVNLMTDLDMTDVDYTPLDKMYIYFNGNGHKISNLTVNGDDHWGGASGLFAYIGNGYIKDLTLENVTSTGSQAGTFIGQSEAGKLINCTLAGDNVVTWSGATADQVGDGIGAFVGVTVESGEFTGTIAEGATVTLVKGSMATDGNVSKISKTDPYVGGLYDKCTPTVNITNEGTISVAITATTTELAQAALDGAKPGDVIQLAPGNYGTLTIKKFWDGNYQSTGITPITIIGGEGVVVGAIDLNGMNFVTIEDITFDASKAVQVYAGSASTGYGNIVDSANTESQSRGANHITVKNCVFTGTPNEIVKDSYEYCPINFMGSNPSSWTYNIKVSGCKFLTNAWNYIRMNNVTNNGNVVIENNIFGGDAYTTSHHAINASANGGDWEIKGNTFINWNPEKCAFATGRSSINEVTDFVITGNTFSNTRIPAEGDDGVIEIKTNSYTTTNQTLVFERNTFAGALEGLNETTIKYVKP